MQVDESVLSRLEKLSNLKISDDKREDIEAQLSDIVKFVENLNELDTTNVEATFSMVKDGATLREDKVTKNETVSKDILSHSPKSEDNFFIVPKIIS